MVGKTLYSVDISIVEEVYGKPTGATCELEECRITSVQKKRRSHNDDKYVFISNVLRSGKKEDLFPKEEIALEQWDLTSHPTYSATKRGAVNKALKSLPKEIRLLEAMLAKSTTEEDRHYYKEYIRLYKTRVKSTLNRMLSRYSKSNKKGTEL